ncbi:MAG: transglycosylase domain-containing protein [Polyangiaceae bacterium]|nr:transglycosylase domain-containing protein [Polyangiaceae bacterium]
MQTSAPGRLRWLGQAGRLASRRWVLVTSAICALALLVVALGVGPLLRALAEKEASQRGVSMRVGRARLGWGVVRLEQVELGAPVAPGVRATLGAIDIRLGFDLSLRAIQAHGGTVHLVGSAEELSRQLDAWRKRHTGRERTGRRSVTYEVDGINAAWRGQPDRDSVQYIWGLRYSREANREQAGADQSRWVYHGTSVDVRRVSLVLGTAGGARRLRSVEVGEGEIDVDLDRLGSNHSGEPTDRVVDRGTASVRDEERSWAGLRTSLARVPALTQRLVEPSGHLALANVHIRLRHGSDALNVGPALIRVNYDAGELVASLGPQAESASKQDTALQMSVRWPLSGTAIGLDLQGGPVSLAALGVKEGDFGLRNVRDAQVELSTKSALSSDFGELTFSGTGRLDHLAFEQPRLATQVVRGLSLGWSGEGRVKLDGSEIAVGRAELAVGDVHLWGRGNLIRGSDYFTIELEGGIPLASCDGMLASAPEGLLPLLAGVRMSGTFGLEGTLRFDTRKPRDILARWSLQSDCRIVTAPARILPDRFRGSFYYDATSETGAPVRIVVGPGTASWVPLFAISRYMELAVLLCEDGGFWRHQGFDKGAIKNALKEDLRVGRFLRGASTISMQTAKNLYLRKDKTLSRKLQEVVLTMLLEQQLSKEQILELYLNVIEYGPGIYGIGPAAQHYFGSPPSQLTLGQALYLASILPNPRVRHFGTDNKLSRGWTGYLHRLMQIAHERKWITDEELSRGLAEEITFGVSSGVTQETIRHSNVPATSAEYEDALEAAAPQPEDAKR